MKNKWTRGRRQEWRSERVVTWKDVTNESATESRRKDVKRGKEERDVY